jgi:hypothetical protein
LSIKTSSMKRHWFVTMQQLLFMPAPVITWATHVQK